MFGRLILWRTLDKHSVRMKHLRKATSNLNGLFIYLSISEYCLAWLYMTWQPCVAMNIWESRDEPTAKVAYVQLLVFGWRRWQWQMLAFIPLRIFRLHKNNSTGPTMNQVLTPFQQIFGKPSPCINSGKKSKRIPFIFNDESTRSCICLRLDLYM
jgi:hypothetical protein